MQVYLFDAESDYELKNESLERSKALDEFYELSEEDGSFMGIITQTKTVQFAWHEEGIWLVDIPFDMENFIALQRYADYDECVQMIEDVYSNIAPERLDGFLPVNIKSETLDEVLERSHFPAFRPKEQDLQVYDDAQWHVKDGSSNNISPDAASTHIGIFLGWAITANLVSDTFKKEISDASEDLKNRKITPSQFLQTHCGGLLSTLQLNKKGNAFAADFYNHKGYLKDYAQNTAPKNLDVLVREDSWENFETVCKILDERFQEWGFRQ